MTVELACLEAEGFSCLDFEPEPRKVTLPGFCKQTALGFANTEEVGGYDEGNVWQIGSGSWDGR